MQSISGSPKAIVAHCCSHSLSLSLTSSCKHPEIDNIFKTYKAITIFFNSSPKREGLLEYIVKSCCIEAEKRKVLVGMCKTRWSERDISCEHFYLGILFIVEAFKIMNRTYLKNNDFDSVYTDGWDSKTKEDETSYLNAITKFEFLIGLVSRYRLLHPLFSITQNLKGRSIDIIKAYNKVESCIQDMQHKKQTTDEEFHKIYKQT